MRAIKLVAVSIVLFLSTLAGAESIRVMSFNTRCSFCDLHHEEGPFAERLKAFADTVVRNQPDLISFQEFMWPKHVKKVLQLLGHHYTALYTGHKLWPTTDSVLMVRNDRFKILKYEAVWLGPKLPKFSFGWKTGIPRRFGWAYLLDTQSNRQFIFVGTHFDNSQANKNPSAAWAQSWFQAQSLPVIFAGDTNLQPDSKGYASLVGKNMRNTFDETKEMKNRANGDYQEVELCTDVHDAAWPTCRIDHVLLSQTAPYKVISWGEDLFRYYKGVKFTSDHRAVIVEVEGVN